MKICHLADIQIRFGSRHNEYREVFKRLLEDLTKVKPDRIVVAGDINHHKINISPGSFELFSELLIGLARIAPTDIILGNHDINLQQLEQGDSISPIFSLSNLIQDNNKKIAYVVSGENKDSLDYSQKAIYFYPDSGFYNISDDLVYGVYSMKDNMMFSLENKKPGVNYIALYHGEIYGARGDNGYQINSDNSIKVSTFNNYDIVMLGDIHEYQTFREDESMAFCGSLIQQNFGESIDKGYLLWDVEKRTHQRKYILNDFGFAKITIAKGERFEERIEHIKFSNNKKKTKVYVVWEDYEENFSQEKENQIIKLIKDRHGCETVKIQFESVVKDVIITENEGEENFKQSEEYLKEFITTGNFDCTKEEISDLVTLHRQINDILEIVEGETFSAQWELNKIEVSNIFSFPVKPTTIDFDGLDGITGVFGKNYNGKSNFIKALVWGLYKEILGGGNPQFITNIYTDSNKGYVRIWITIDGQKFFVERSVKTTKKKDGTTSNSYTINYKKLEFGYDDDGNLDSEKWENEQSDEKTAEKNEVSKLVESAIGTFDDFTKTSLQTQGGKDDYLNMSQQPKNSLVSKFLGLEPYKLRYEYGNETFKDIKKKQKELGDKVEIESTIKKLNDEKSIKSTELSDATQQKNEANDKREKTDSEILELTKKIEKLETTQINSVDSAERLIVQNEKMVNDSTPLLKELETWISKNFKKELLITKPEALESLSINDPIKANELIEQHKIEIENSEKQANSIELWLSVNFKKELPFDDNISTDQLNITLEKEKQVVVKNKKELSALEDWLNKNPLKQIININGFDGDIDSLKLSISQLEGLLDTYKGKKCPTCGHVHAKAKPDKEDECLEDIKMKKELLFHKQEKIKESNIVNNHNSDFESKTSKLEVLKQTIVNGEEKIVSTQKKIDLINQSQDIVKHNNDVESNSINFKKLKTRIEFLEKEIRNLEDILIKIQSNKEKEIRNKSIQEAIDEVNNHNRIVDNKTKEFSKLKVEVENAGNQITILREEIVKINNNAKKAEANKSIQEKIYGLTELSKAYKLTVYNMEKQCTNLFGDIRVLENNIKTQEEKLLDITEYEQLFKKYSVYLQAMHRDGIPALIIRKKLPLINHRINTILQQAVDFKINLDILTNGDIVETFYFNDSKSDTLPLSFASGAQKFVSSIAIKDGLHYISSLTKPSLCIIDEGFGTLDDELTFEIMNILNYLKNKHKNVIVITHRDEIKDFADNIIEVMKVKTGISQEMLDANPKAGVTKLNIV